MSLHDVFTVLCVIAHIILIALTVYGIKKENALPIFVGLAVSSFFKVMVSLTA